MAATSVPRTIKLLYTALKDGEHLTDEELVILRGHLDQTQTLLRELGPIFLLAAREALASLNTVEEFIRARKERTGTVHKWQQIRDNFRDGKPVTKCELLFLHKALKEESATLLRLGPVYAEESDAIRRTLGWVEDVMKSRGLMEVKQMEVKQNAWSN